MFFDPKTGFFDSKTQTLGSFFKIYGKSGADSIKISGRTISVTI